ncbi:tRNA (adenosine(37)-N6)-threonylcarbamoyltransferase complex ATPase subunit type 1 TsaE [Devosia sp.]|uniref:tRNA (adenosine(37)-N6)-threonylcarbamoyltransferase complex ATPase subunit type 1 TsaE n=1 Tax=Devosia sp. TaxID=1871048 RepID=UPI002F1904ED
MPGPVTLHLADEAATAALGVRLAEALRPGDVVLLAGDLGAGKTALARAVIRHLMADPDLDVPSPSFALVQPYEGGGHVLLHADLYRLASERDIDELGLFDRPEAILLVEWPERAPGLAARANIVVTLSLPADRKGRIAVIDAPAERRI